MANPAISCLKIGLSHRESVWKIKQEILTVKYLISNKCIKVGSYFNHLLDCLKFTARFLWQKAFCQIWMEKAVKHDIECDCIALITFFESYSIHVCIHFLRESTIPTAVRPGSLILAFKHTAAKNHQMFYYKFLLLWVCMARFW